MKAKKKAPRLARTVEALLLFVWELITWALWKLLKDVWLLMRATARYSIDGKEWHWTLRSEMRLAMRHRSKKLEEIKEILRR